MISFILYTHIHILKSILNHLEGECIDHAPLVSYYFNVYSKNKNVLLEKQRAVTKFRVVNIKTIFLLNL